MTRLDQMREYLRLAELQPEENKLYIEDLKLSIRMFEQQVNSPMDLIIGKGFVDIREQAV